MVSLNELKFFKLLAPDCRLLTCYILFAFFFFIPLEILIVCINEMRMQKECTNLSREGIILQTDIIGVERGDHRGISR